MKFTVTLVKISSNDTRVGTYEGENRHECIRKAYNDLVSPRYVQEVIDAWKVLDVKQHVETTCGGMSQRTF